MIARIKNSFILRYIAATTLAFILVAAGGNWVSQYFLNFKEGRLEIQHLMRSAFYINSIAEKKRIKPSELITHINTEYPGFAPEYISVIDSNKRLVGPVHLPPHLSAEMIFEFTPKTPLQVRRLPQDKNVISVRLTGNEVLFRFVQPPHMVYADFEHHFFPPHPPHPPRPPHPGEHQINIHQGTLPGWNPGVHITHPQVFGMRPEQFNTLVFIVCLVLGYMFFLVSSLYLFRRTANHASKILSELKSGNLKSRFPTSGFDNLGQISVRFNEMADELEKLFLRLKTAESQRKDILQELVHDLRTPVTSLKSQLETLRDHADNIKIEQKIEFLEICLTEVHYFDRLVSDLLFVSELKDPTVGFNSHIIKLSDVLNNKIHLYSSKGVELIANYDEYSDYPVLGDHQLIERLFSNALDNAISFAKSKVTISIQDGNSYWQISISDDGDGIDEKKIEKFGEKSSSRRVSKKSNGRISIGLGAYIMKKIILSHNGKLNIKNEVDGEKIIGATLIIQLPKGKIERVFEV